ncbi:prelamin-A/C-like [Sebastes fasciatus]|uniref:prelamin-A/C-like n=1 Tax=Sebastes fasciatus TaxID=394691 RepID=UPI003D9F81ED
MNDAEKEVENLKKEMEDESSSASQSSTTELPIVVEVNQKGNYIRLIKKSPKDQPLGGWTLEMEVNRKIISYTFKPSFKLKSGSKFTMTGRGCFQQYDLCWKDLTPWNSGDSLKFTLISDTGVRHQLNSY